MIGSFGSQRTQNRLIPRYNIFINLGINVLFLDNRFNQDVLGVIEKNLQYQHKICLAEEGLKVLRLEV